MMSLFAYDQHLGGTFAFNSEHLLNSLEPLIFMIQEELKSLRKTKSRLEKRRQYLKTVPEPPPDNEGLIPVGDTLEDNLYFEIDAHDNCIEGIATGALIVLDSSVRHTAKVIADTLQIGQRDALCIGISKSERAWPSGVVSAANYIRHSSDWVENGAKWGLQKKSEKDLISFLNSPHSGRVKQMVETINTLSVWGLSEVALLTGRIKMLRLVEIFVINCESKLIDKFPEWENKVVAEVERRSRRESHRKCNPYKK